MCSERMVEMYGSHTRTYDLVRVHTSKGEREMEYKCVNVCVCPRLRAVATTNDLFVFIPERYDMEPEDWEELHYYYNRRPPMPPAPIPRAVPDPVAMEEQVPAVSPKRKVDDDADSEYTYCLPSPPRPLTTKSLHRLAVSNDYPQ